MPDAFLSHSTRDDGAAKRLSQVLEANGLKVWNDEADIRAGVLLGGELQRAIWRCDTLVLLWSTNSASSRWVQSEWLTALLVGKFILPVLLDDTALPFCFQNSIGVDMKVAGPGRPKDVVRQVREGRGRQTTLAPVMRSPDPALRQAFESIALGQKEVLKALGTRELQSAADTQILIDPLMEKLNTAFRSDLDVLNLGGYHLKNAYMIENWDAIQSGRAPKDPLLDRAERRFLETLSVDPTYPDALNGIGNVFFYERELDAAIFFARAALACAPQHGHGSYSAAENDLEMYRRFKAASEQREQRRPVVEV